MADASAAAAAVGRSPSQPCIVNVIYPAGCKFDHDYYLKTHMPLVQQHWGPVGLQSWSITKLPEDSGFCVQAVLHWESIDSFIKAKDSESGKIVLGDIPVFCDVAPQVWVGSKELSS